MKNLKEMTSIELIKTIDASDDWCWDELHELVDRAAALDGIIRDVWDGEHWGRIYSETCRVLMTEELKSFIGEDVRQAELFPCQPDRWLVSFPDGSQSTYRLNKDYTFEMEED